MLNNANICKEAGCASLWFPTDQCPVCNILHSPGFPLTSTATADCHTEPLCVCLRKIISTGHTKTYQAIEFTEAWQASICIPKALFQSQSHTLASCQTPQSTPQLPSFPKTPHLPWMARHTHTQSHRNLQLQITYCKCDQSLANHNSSQLQALQIHVKNCTCACTCMGAGTYKCAHVTLYGNNNMFNPGMYSHHMPSRRKRKAWLLLAGNEQTASNWEI